jgi:hypothetical protein
MNDVRRPPGAAEPSHRASPEVDEAAAGASVVALPACCVAVPLVRTVRRSRWAARESRDR